MIINQSQLGELAPRADIFTRENNTSRYMYGGKKTSVFLSHKHDEIIELKRVANVLEQCDSVVYVDWLDKSMPDITCGETAAKIKSKIRQYDKFILVATDRAIASKWCNWELGFGDAQKYEEGKIALFPIKKNSSDWTGSEYMELYPVIEFFDGKKDWCDVTFNYPYKGFYVVYRYGRKRIISLDQWLNL